MNAYMRAMWWQYGIWIEISVHLGDLKVGRGKRAYLHSTWKNGNAIFYVKIIKKDSFKRMSFFKKIALQQRLY